MLPRDRISTALTLEGRPAIVAFLTAGYPDPSAFLETLRKTLAGADAVELGVPFSDPMADGVTIQRSSEKAIASGVNLHWIFDQLEARDYELEAPLLMMSYLNPLLAYGYEALADRAAATGVDGFLVPDLPFEESAPLRSALDRHGLALVQFVTPATSTERMATIAANSQGLVYAVTRTGITGDGGGLPAELTSYLAQVKSVSSLPVCAGFGVREAEQVRQIAEYADGVIVGSALVEALERGEDPEAFLNNLRG
ncbi:MAG: tryptophan synthase subunit alpha [Gammaproteobacteria bacterium]|jgi:tryptophan synthase alpha chain